MGSCYCSSWCLILLSSVVWLCGCSSIVDFNLSELQFCVSLTHNQFSFELKWENIKFPVTFNATCVPECKFISCRSTTANGCRFPIKNSNYDVSLLIAASSDSRQHISLPFHVNRFDKCREESKITNIFVMESGVTSTAITVQWTVQDVSKSKSHRLVCYNGETTIIQDVDQRTSYTFKNLQPWSRYRICIATLQDGTQRDRFRCLKSTVQTHIPEVNITIIDSPSVRLRIRWTALKRVHDTVISIYFALNGTFNNDTKCHFFRAFYNSEAIERITAFGQAYLKTDVMCPRVSQTAKETVIPFKNVRAVEASVSNLQSGNYELYIVVKLASNKEELRLNKSIVVPLPRRYSTKFYKLKKTSWTPSSTVSVNLDSYDPFAISTSPAP